MSDQTGSLRGANTPLSSGSIVMGERHRLGMETLRPDKTERSATMSSLFKIRRRSVSSEGRRARHYEPVVAVFVDDRSRRRAS
jgi:hypothetical protein